jgi:hypothetical protein
MNTRMKLLALAFAAPLALAACDGAEEQQVGEAEEPAATPPAGQDDTAGVAEESEERQAAELPEESAEQPPAAGEPAAPPEQETAQAPEAGAGAEQPPAAGEPAAPPEQETAQAPEAGAGAEQPEAGAAAPAEGEVDFAGNWALEGEACPGEWEFTEQTVEIPEQGTFEVEDVQQSGQEVELEVTSMEGQLTQSLALEFPDPAQQDTMIVRNGGDEVTLQRCE